MALDRPKQIISDMANLQKQIDRHMISLRRSDRWPLGLLDETRSRIHEEAAENVRKVKEEYHTKACELRWTQGIAAAELAGFHELREKMVKKAVRTLAQKSILAEKARLEAMKRAIRGIMPEGKARAGPSARSAFRKPVAEMARDMTEIVEVVMVEEEEA